MIKPSWGGAISGGVGGQEESKPIKFVCFKVFDTNSMLSLCLSKDEILLLLCFCPEILEKYWRQLFASQNILLINGQRLFASDLPQDALLMLFLQFYVIFQ